MCVGRTGLVCVCGKDGGEGGGVEVGVGGGVGHTSSLSRMR